MINKSQPNTFLMTQLQSITSQYAKLIPNDTDTLESYKASENTVLTRFAFQHVKFQTSEHKEGNHL